MLGGVLQWFGYGLCHQLPERSFFGGGVQVPVCARDTGIYLGFMISLAIVAAVHRGERPRAFPTTVGWIVIGVLIGVMGLDGVSSYSGLRETTNELRLITGLCAGFATAAIIFPMLNDELWVSPGLGRVLDPAWRLVVWLLGIPLAYVLVLHVAPRLGIGFPVVVSTAVVGTLAAINLVIVAMFPAFDRRINRATQLVVPLLIAVALALAEIWLAGLFRALLESLARGLGG